MPSITGGALRGRAIALAKGTSIRPTTARVRSAIFQVWQHADRLQAPFLDLFAGSGLIALEALSRGAPEAFSIERSRSAVQAMRRLARSLGLELRWRILQGEVERTLPRLRGTRFGVIYADPPYRYAKPEAIAAAVQRAQIHCEELAIELAAGAMPNWPHPWRCIEVRRYGSTAIHRLERAR